MLVLRYGRADGLRVVTLKGELCPANGPVQAGSDAGQLTRARPRQRKSLQEQTGALSKQLEGVSQRISQTDSLLKELMQEEAGLEIELEISRWLR
jgi:chromosome segregation ATPase